MKKKLFSLCLAVILIFSILPTATFAETNTVTVASDADWAAFCANATENANATLQITADFHMGGVQFPEEFTGTVYGNGHTVTFGTDTAENWACALFAKFAGTAYDLILGNDNDSTDKISTGKTGEISGAFANQVTGDAAFYNLINKAYVVTAKANYHVGGLVGIIKGSNATVIFENCQNACVNSTGVVAKQASARGGGLVGVVTGTNVNLTFRNCANNGKVTAANAQAASIGGFVGYWKSANGSLTFDRCVNSYSINQVKGPMAG
ncbi:MAG: hypothetical protein E7620_06475, partial [Ruminococcaceae bacterium]|nr:hypothetical protein [Oscillospiraceae bacterium]